MDRASFLDAFHQRMETFRRTGKMCDAKLIAKGSDRQGSKNKTTPVEFLVHMSVLSAASAHFEQVFDAGMKESVVGVVELNMDADILEKLIVYMYTGHIQIDADSAPHILPEAAYLQLADLREACAKFLLSNITPSNCLEMWSFACVFSCEEMKEIAWKTACEKFDIVSTSRSIIDMEFTSFVLLIKDKRLRCKESSVYMAVINWVRGKDERKEYLAPLLSHVRLTAMDPAFLTGTVGKEPLIRHDAECFDLFLEALESISHRFSLTSGTRDRNPLQLAWSVNSREWTNAPSFKTHDLLLCSVAVCNGALYCVGRNGETAARLVLSTGQWEDVAPTQNAFIQTVGTSLYAFRTNNYHCPITRFDDRTNKWEAVYVRNTSSGTSIQVLDATSDGTTLYIADETNIYEMNDKTECTVLTKLRNIENQDTTTTNKMCAVNGELYIVCHTHRRFLIGHGRNGNQLSSLSVHIFDIAKKMWRDGPPLLNMKHPFNVVACDDTLIVEHCGVLQCLHKNKWQQLPDTGDGAKSHSIAAHGNILFCVNNEEANYRGAPVKVRTIALDTTSLETRREKETRRRESREGAETWNRASPGSLVPVGEAVSGGASRPSIVTHVVYD